MSMNSSCNKTISNRIKQYRMLCKMPFSNFKSKTVVPIRCRKVHRPRNKKVKVLNSVKQPTTTNRIPILMRSQHRKKKRRSSRFLDRVESMLKFVITSYRPGQIRMHSNSWRRMMWNNKIFNNSWFYSSSRNITMKIMQMARMCNILNRPSNRSWERMARCTWLHTSSQLMHNSRLKRKSRSD